MSGTSAAIESVEKFRVRRAVCSRIIDSLAPTPIANAKERPLCRQRVNDSIAFGVIVVSVTDSRSFPSLLKGALGCIGVYRFPVIFVDHLARRSDHCEQNTLIATRGSSR